jgi:hypothetical protein
MKSHSLYMIILLLCFSARANAEGEEPHSKGGYRS